MRWSELLEGDLVLTRWNFNDVKGHAFVLVLEQKDVPTKRTIYVRYSSLKQNKEKCHQKIVSYVNDCSLDDFSENNILWERTVIRDGNVVWRMSNALE